MSRLEEIMMQIIKTQAWRFSIESQDVGLLLLLPRLREIPAGWLSLTVGRMQRQTDKQHHFRVENKSPYSKSDLFQIQCLLLADMTTMRTSISQVVKGEYLVAL